MYEKYTYRVMWSDDDNEYVGLCSEFPSLSWLNRSQEAAFKGIRKLVADVVRDMEAQGETVPEPLSTKHFSGKFMVRVPPEVHRQLTQAALEAHISLNRYVNAKLAMSVSQQV